MRFLELELTISNFPYMNTWEIIKKNIVAIKFPDIVAYQTDYPHIKKWLQISFDETPDHEVFNFFYIWIYAYHESIGTLDISYMKDNMKYQFTSVKPKLIISEKDYNSCDSFSPKRTIFLSGTLNPNLSKDLI